MSYISDDNLIQNRLTNFTNPEIHNNQDGLYLFSLDWNVYPIGFYLNDMRSLFYLDINQTLKYFTNDFNVSIGFSYNAKPTSLTEFDMSKVDEVFTFEWNLTKENQYTPVNTLLQPHLFRYEFFGVVQFSLFLVFYAFIFVILLIIRKKQPLASRGLTPILACIIQFLLTFSGITQFVFTLQLNKVNCYISRLIIGPLIISVIYLAIFNFFRYIMIINLNNRKALYIQNKENNGNQRTYLSRAILIILKVVRHWGFHIIIFVVFYIFISGIFIIVSASSEFNCQLTGDNIVTRNQASATDTVFAVILIILFIIGIIIALIDIFSNIIFIIKEDALKLWNDDIYYFRLEILILGLCITFPYFIIIFILKQTIYGEDELYYGWNYYDYSILNSISYHLLFIMQVLFVLTITIVKWVFSLCRKKTNDSAMVNLLKDQELLTLFQKFIRNEFSEENLICFKEIQKFKLETDTEKRKNLANEMVKTYFNGADSSLEINVDWNYCNQIKKKLNDTEISNDIFEDVERVVKTNLYDSFSRFSSTKVYYDYEKKSQQVQELLK